MILASNQYGLIGLSASVRQRLELLGVTVASVGADGWVTVHGPSRWIERLITDSPQFAATVRQHSDELVSSTGRSIELWPGVWLVSLPVTQHGSQGPADSGPLIVAIFLTADLIDSEWLSLLCDTQQVDRRVVNQRVDRAGLVSPAEVQRLAALLSWMQQDAAHIDRQTHELHEVTLQLAESYEELNLLYKLSLGMTADQPAGPFLTEACTELREVLGLKWISLVLTKEQPLLGNLSGGSFSTGTTGIAEQVLAETGANLMRRHQHMDSPRVIDDFASQGVPQLAGLAKNVLVVPLRNDEGLLGVLLGGDKLNGQPISSVDSKLCDSLAHSLTAFLKNQMFYEDVQGMFMGTLHALTTSIDAKDSYTHGHSERVAMMSRQLAEAAGLDGNYVERIHLSALLHDVGKIGVPEEVLCKKGRLTDDEFKMVKQHPLIGARIISDIRQMQDLIPGVLYHHERWDGGGYPHHLAGGNIPLPGRVICLADSFDAMSSNRSYRSAMKHEDTLQEIRRCAGAQFDPKLAELFVKLDFEPFYGMIREHQAQEAAHTGVPS